MHYIIYWSRVWKRLVIKVGTTHARTRRQHRRRARAWQPVRVALLRLRARCGGPLDDYVDGVPYIGRRCAACGDRIRPGVVWFGEALPDDAWSTATDAATRCSLMLVVGTSGLVYPAAGLPVLARRHGATVVASGIGATYADRFARRGHNLVLVARDIARMEALATQLREENNITIDIIKADLTQPNELAVVESRLRDDSQIGILINNAGASLGGSFIEQTTDDIEQLVTLNTTALVRLAVQLHLDSHKRARCDHQYQLCGDC